MKNIRAADPPAAELSRVAIVADLENSAPNVRRTPLQEVLDIVTIDGLTPVEPELAADRG
jgi:hypothetical protein